MFSIRLNRKTLAIWAAVPEFFFLAEAEYPVRQSAVLLGELNSFCSRILILLLLMLFRKKQSLAHTVTLCDTVTMAFGFHFLNRKNQLVSFSLIWTSIRERNVPQMGKREGTPNLSKPKNPVSILLLFSWAVPVKHWTILLFIFRRLFCCICQLDSVLCRYTSCCGNTSFCMFRGRNRQVCRKQGTWQLISEREVKSTV